EVGRDIVRADASDDARTLLTSDKGGSVSLWDIEKASRIWREMDVEFASVSPRGWHAFVVSSEGASKFLSDRPGFELRLWTRDKGWRSIASSNNDGYLGDGQFLDETRLVYFQRDLET